MRAAVALLVLLVRLLVMASLSTRSAHATRLERVTVYYDTGSVMASGQWPFYGALACSYRWPLGTRLTLASPSGAAFTGTCLDRGRLDEYGVSVDVYMPSYADGRWWTATFGDWLTITEESSE